jgi:hypothetical protein
MEVHVKEQPQVNYVPLNHGIILVQTVKSKQIVQ